MKTKSLLAVCSILLAVSVSLFAISKHNIDNSIFEENVEALSSCEIDGWVPGNYTIIVYSTCHWACNAGGTSPCPV